MALQVALFDVSLLGCKGAWDVHLSVSIPAHNCTMLPSCSGGC
jgi:hypothetical protein